MRTASVIIFAALAVLGLVMGGRYFGAKALLPYQQRAVGKDWEQIAAGERVVFLAMLRVVGGGFLTLGVAMAWAAYEIRSGAFIAPWAALAIGVAGLGPALSATLLIRRFQPDARAPTGLTLAALALIVAGAALALLAPASG